MVRPIDQPVSEAQALFEPAPNIGEPVPVEVDERVHGQSPLRLPVAAEPDSQQVGALLAVGAAVDPVDRLRPEETWSLPLQLFVDAERRDFGVAAGIEKRNACGDLEWFRGVGL